MAFKKSAASADPCVWTVIELSVFYTAVRSMPLAHASGVLKELARG